MSNNLPFKKGLCDACLEAEKLDRLPERSSIQIYVEGILAKHLRKHHCKCKGLRHCLGCEIALTKDNANMEGDWAYCKECEDNITTRYSEGENDET